MRDAQALVETLDRLIAQGQVARGVAGAAPRAPRGRAWRASRARGASSPPIPASRESVRCRDIACGVAGAAVERADRNASARRARPRHRSDRVAGARARAAGRDEDWHRWRRRVRRLSQQHRAIGPQFVDINSARQALQVARRAARRGAGLRVAARSLRQALDLSRSRSARFLPRWPTRHASACAGASTMRSSSLAPRAGRA